MIFKFKMIKEEHIDKVTDFVTKAYYEEKESIDFFPEEDYSKIFRKRVKHVFTNGIGVVAFSDNKIIGFMAGYEINELWGKSKGIYIPLCGHGAMKNNRRKIYQKLYKKAAEIWIEKGITHHSITLYAQDEDLIDTWFWLGFGLRCVDAIREVKKITQENSEINIKKVRLNDVFSLSDIDSKHNLYYKESPIFMPVEDEDAISNLTEWLSRENHHMWMVLYNKKVIGYMRIEPNGERFVTENKNIMNITGAYLDEKYRGKNIGKHLLGEIQNWLLNNGYKFCGVDYESFNISGSNFWNKFFTPYTYTLVRRIDERIL